MTIAVLPFTPDLVDPAARLLSRSYAALQEANAIPMTNLSNVDWARASISESLGGGPAAVAIRGGGLSGFLMSSLAKGPGLGRARIGLMDHAVEPAGGRETYRRLYASIAGALVDSGARLHTIAIPAGDPEVSASWFELGFGIDQVIGVRDLDDRRERIAESPVHVRSADAGDLDELAGLAVDLQDYHADAPIFDATPGDRIGSSQNLERSLSDDSRHVFVATDGKRLVGMMEVGPDPVYPNAAKIGMAFVTSQARRQGIGAAILRHVMWWARNRGRGQCSVGWTSANLVSDPFWRNTGFQPAHYRLARRVDQPAAE